MDRAVPRRVCPVEHLGGHLRTPGCRLLLRFDADRVPLHTVGLHEIFLRQTDRPVGIDIAHELPPDRRRGAATLAVVVREVDRDAAAALGGLTEIDFRAEGRAKLLFQRGDLLLARNTHATLARNVVLIGGGDYQGRTLTSSKSLAAGDEVIFGRLEENGWVDPTNGMVLVNVDGNAGDVRFWVLR